MRRQLIKDARQAKGWTALDLGERINQSEEHVYQVERGRYRPKPNEAAAWAEALGLTPAIAFPEIFGQPATTEAVQ